MSERNARYTDIDRRRIEAAMREARRLRAEHIAGGIRRLAGKLRRGIADLGRRARTGVGAHA